ncbi:hypothetical protein [Archangium lipolyticum]|uniref:hypothetical protein n=1 Tax=Archangium lipolyticum TaxID=2970465 RepID=UPI00214A7290|nr:hypothetical protein [Archangium lipolyticum]
MKRSGFVAAIWLGVSLSAAGCGGTEVSSNADSLESTAQEMRCHECGDPWNEPEDPEPVDPPPPPSSSCPSTLPEPADRLSLECKYKKDSQSPRCVYSIPSVDCTAWQNYARMYNLVTDDGLAYLRQAHLCPALVDYGRWPNDFHISIICPLG